MSSRKRKRVVARPDNERLTLVDPASSVSISNLKPSYRHWGSILPLIWTYVGFDVGPSNIPWTDDELALVLRTLEFFTHPIRLGVKQPGGLFDNPYGSITDYKQRTGKRLKKPRSRRGLQQWNEKQSVQNRLYTVYHRVLYNRVLSVPHAGALFQAGIVHIDDYVMSGVSSPTYLPDGWTQLKIPDYRLAYCFLNLEFSTSYLSTHLSHVLLDLTPENQQKCLSIRQFSADQLTRWITRIDPSIYKFDELLTSILSYQTAALENDYSLVKEWIANEHVAVRALMTPVLLRVPNDEKVMQPLKTETKLDVAQPLVSTWKRGDLIPYLSQYLSSLGLSDRKSDEAEKFCDQFSSWLDVVSKTLSKRESEQLFDQHSATTVAHLKQWKRCRHYKMYGWCGIVRRFSHQFWLQHEALAFELVHDIIDHDHRPYSSTFAEFLGRLLDSQLEQLNDEKRNNDTAIDILHATWSRLCLRDVPLNFLQTHLHRVLLHDWPSLCFSRRDMPLDFYKRYASTNIRDMRTIENMIENPIVLIDTVLLPRAKQLVSDLFLEWFV